METTWTGKALTVNLDAEFVKANGAWLADFDARVAALEAEYAEAVSSVKEADALLKARREARNALAGRITPLWVEAADKHGYTSGPNVPATCNALRDVMVRAGMSTDAFRKAVQAERDRRDPARVAARRKAAETRALTTAAKTAGQRGSVVPSEPDDVVSHVVSVYGTLDTSHKLTALDQLAEVAVAESGALTEADALVLSAIGRALDKAGKARAKVAKAEAQLPEPASAESLAKASGE